MKYLYKLLIFTTTNIAILPLSAQEKDTLTTQQQLNEVVVTAHRGEKLAFDTPASIYGLDQKQLKYSQPRTTPEALTGSMGVFLQKTTHGAGSPFLRGLTGNQTLFLVDGIRLNNSTFRYGPNQYFNTIDAFSLDHIEVLAGGGSVQYGSDALSGAIQVFTKDALLNTRLKADMMLRYGSAGMEQSLRANLNYGNSKSAIRGGFTIRKFGDAIGGKLTGFQKPSGYNEIDFDLKSKHLLTQKLTLTLAYQNVAQTNIPNYYRYQLENYSLNTFDPQKRQLAYAKLQHKTNHATWKEQTLTLSYQQTTEGRQSQKIASNTRRYEEDLVKTLGVNLNNLSDWQKWGTMNTGIELYYDKVKSSRYDLDIQNNTKKYSRGLYPNGATYLNYSFYSLWQVAFFRKFEFTSGIRYNGFFINVPDETIGNSRISPSALVGNVGLSWAFAENSRLFLSQNTGFRAPNIDDLGTLGIVDFRYEVPTQNLKPEKASNIEIGYKLQAKRIKLMAVYYESALKNLITRVKTAEVINGLNVYQKENVEKAKIHGFDAMLNANILTNVLIWSNLSYCFGQNITKNEPMRRIPPLNGRIGLAYEKQPWYLRGEYIFAQKQDRLAQGDKDDIRIQKGGTPAWKIINMYAGIEKKTFGINARIENIFDEDYRTHGSGINGVGRSVWLSATVRF